MSASTAKGPMTMDSLVVTDTATVQTLTATNVVSTPYLTTSGDANVGGSAMVTRNLQVQGISYLDGGLRTTRGTGSYPFEVPLTSTALANLPPTTKGSIMLTAAREATGPFDAQLASAEGGDAFTLILINYSGASVRLWTPNNLQLSQPLGSDSGSVYLVAYNGNEYSGPIPLPSAVSPMMENPFASYTYSDSIPALGRFQLQKFGYIAVSNEISGDGTYNLQQSGNGSWFVAVPVAGSSTYFYLLNCRDNCYMGQTHHDGGYMGRLSAISSTSTPNDAYCQWTYDGDGGFKLSQRTIWAPIDSTFGWLIIQGRPSYGENNTPVVIDISSPFSWDIVYAS